MSHLLRDDDRFTNATSNGMDKLFPSHIFHHIPFMENKIPFMRNLLHLNYCVWQTKFN